MEERGEKAAAEELSAFLSSGLYRLRGASAFFIDPVRLHDHSYSRFRVSPASYYSRFFGSDCDACAPLEEPPGGPRSGKKRRRPRRTSPKLNESEAAAERRHQEIRPFLLKAYGAFLEEKDLLSCLSNLREDGCHSSENEVMPQPEEYTPLSFIELGNAWQAPLYEMLLCSNQNYNLLDGEKGWSTEQGEIRPVKVFDSLVVNDSHVDAEAEFLDKFYILPRRSSFYMSDLKQIRALIPDQSADGFNLIVIDPPWENGSARQKSLYPTLPNRYFLGLPIKQLIHSEGALVALWVTNREKLRAFVERELLPAWGIKSVASFYWLKVKADGSLICDLDLPHHKPYECLLLGYSHGKEAGSKPHPSLIPLPDNEILISIPGDHSRKPPLGNMLSEYVPGPKPPRCMELFARSMTAGWTSWGNEPLHFQELKYFVRQREKISCDQMQARLPRSSGVGKLEEMRMPMVCGRASQILCSIEVRTSEFEELGTLIADFGGCREQFKLCGCDPRPSTTFLSQIC